MPSLFQCPPPAALPTIPAQACAEKFDQIQAILFQRKQTAPSFTTTTVLLQATWTPLLAATNNTKISKSPLFPGLTLPPGEILSTGGNDNTTLNGVRQILGLSSVTVNGQLRNANKAIRAALQSLTAESAIQTGFTNLTAYFVNRFGEIIANVNGTNVTGIEIFNFVVGDPGTEGFNADNISNMSFDLAPGWSDNVEIIKPSFNPLNL